MALIASRDQASVPAEVVQLRGRCVVRAHTLPVRSTGSAAYAMAVCARTARLAQAWSDGSTDVISTAEACGVTRRMAAISAVELAACVPVDGAGVAFAIADNMPAAERVAARAAMARASSQLAGGLALYAACWNPNTEGVRADAWDGWLACGGELGVVICATPERRGAARRTLALGRVRVSTGRPRGRPRKARAPSESEEEDEEDEENEDEDEGSCSQVESDGSGSDVEEPELGTATAHSDGDGDGDGEAGGERRVLQGAL